MNEELKNAISLIESYGYTVARGRIDEGIDIDRDKKIVSFTKKHEDNVDTSIETNPTFDITTVNGVQIWSIFKRKNSSRGDGNPLIYALKGERGWKFRSEYDRKKVLEQFASITDKFVKTHGYEITLLIPSSSRLNNYIAEMIEQKSSGPVTIIDDLIIKLTTSEVEEIVRKPNSKFNRHYKTEYERRQAISDFERYLDNMDREKGGRFARHYIPDFDMRKLIDSTLKVSDDRAAEYANMINGSDLLIIDDTVTNGDSIRETIKLIKQCYAPKSITVLTLLSKLYEIENN